MENGNEQLHLAELEMMRFFVEVCKRYKLTYYMLGGTFLGAVRHKGFIPWDDDMDIGMPREDYDRFTKIIQSIDMAYIYTNYEISESNIYFGRLENKSIQLLDNSSRISKVKNAWIDVFPLDGMPNNSVMRNIHKFRLLFSRLLLQYSQFDEHVNIHLPNRPLHEKVLIFIGSIIKPERFISIKTALKILDKNLRKYKYSDSEYVVNFMGAYKFKEMFRKEIYKDLVEYDFEFIKLYGPRNYDLVLSSLYGDYMTPPKEDEKNKHFTKIVIKE